jgi:DNA-binding transcriptional ArsR family regulator
LQGEERSNTLHLSTDAAIRDVEVLKAMAKRKRKKKAATVSANGGPVDGVLAKALSHPTRCEILAFLTEQDIASPVEMERAGLGENGASEPHVKKLPHISYHIRVLSDYGLIRLVDSRPVRGSTEHFYEAVGRMMLDIDEWSKLPPRAKNDVSIKAVEESFSLAAKALSAGTFDSFNERAVINLTLRLDEDGFKQLAEEITDFALQRCEQLQAEAAGRVEGDMSKLMFSSASFLLYESPRPKRKGS